MAKAPVPPDGLVDQQLSLPPPRRTGFADFAHGDDYSCVAGTKMGELMTVRRRSVTSRGSILALAGLVLAAGCAARRPHVFGIPMPLQLQTAIAVDRQGNEILAGAFAGHLRIGGGELVSAGGTDIFLSKTAPNGAPVFPPQRFGGRGDDAATGVAVDDDGSIVVVGTFQGDASFGSQAIKADVRHPGQD